MQPSELAEPESPSTQTFQEGLLTHLWAGHLQRRKTQHRTPPPGFEVITAPLDQVWMGCIIEGMPDPTCEIIHWKEGSARQALWRAGHTVPDHLLLDLQKAMWNHSVQKLNVMVLISGLKDPPTHKIGKARDWVVFHVGGFIQLPEH